MFWFYLFIYLWFRLFGFVFLSFSTLPPRDVAAHGKQNVTFVIWVLFLYFVLTTDDSSMKYFSTLQSQVGFCKHFLVIFITFNSYFGIFGEASSFSSKSLTLEHSSPKWILCMTPRNRFKHLSGAFPLSLMSRALSLRYPPE